MTGTVEFIQRIRYVEIPDEKGEMQVYAIPETVEDVRELVRCKDCKHWYFADNRIPSEQENVCGRNGIVVTPDWFCADGERRETDA